MSVLRAIGWNALLALAFIPALIATVVLLPWLPLLARPVDAYGRLSARIFASPIRHRTVSRWFDWRQVLHLFLQLLVSCLSMIIWAVLGSILAVMLIAPFAVDTLEFNSWQSTNRALNVTLCFSIAAVTLILLATLAWAMTWLSVQVSKVTLSPSVREVEDSRALLADAFSGERRRIERELHDGPQQHLTALRLNLAASRLTSDPEAALSKAEETPPRHWPPCGPRCAVSPHRCCTTTDSWLRWRSWSPTQESTPHCTLTQLPYHRWMRPRHCWPITALVRD